MIKKRAVVVKQEHRIDMLIVGNAEMKDSVQNAIENPANLASPASPANLANPASLAKLTDVRTVK